MEGAPDAGRSQSPAPRDSGGDDANAGGRIRQPLGRG